MAAHTDWELIAPDNLPKFGDLVLSSGCAFVMRVMHNHDLSFEDWTNPQTNDWKWKAKLILPKEVQQANQKLV